jgi:hypothetical protein
MPLVFFNRILGRVPTFEPYASNLLGQSIDMSVVNSSVDRNAETAVLSLTSSDSSGQRRNIPCLFHGIEGKRLTVESEERAPLSAVVSVQCDDTLFLGEVITSVPAANGSWRAEVKVEQILTGLQSLMNLRSHLLSEVIGQTLPEVSPAYMGARSRVISYAAKECSKGS